MGIRTTASRTAGRRPMPAALRRSLEERQSFRRIRGVASDQSKGADRTGVRVHHFRDRAFARPVERSLGVRWMSNIVVPQLGESVVEARIARWLKHEGDRIETGEPVVELETDKIDLEVGADHAGVLSSIKHQEGEDVKVGDVLAVVSESEAPRAAAPSRSGPPEGSEPTPAAEPPTPASAGDAPRATPTARR